MVNKRFDVQINGKEFQTSKSIVQAKSTKHAGDLKNKYTIQEKNCIFEDESNVGDKTTPYNQVFLFFRLNST